MPRRRQLSWSDAKERFLLHLRARNLSPRTVYCYGLEVERLAEHLENAGPLDVTTDDLRGYQVALLTGDGTRSGKPLSPRSAYRVACTLATFFRWLVEQGDLSKDPTAKLERPKLNQPLPGSVLTVEETDRLLAAAEGGEPLALRNRAAVELLYATGIRRAELVALDLDDVDLRERVVRVRRGKGDKARQVPLTRSACVRLEAYLERGRPELDRHSPPALLLTAWGKRMGAATIMRLLHSLADAAGIDKQVTPHTLRRTFATHLLQNQVNLRAIQLLLGHEKLSTTAEYLCLDPEELRREILSHHPRERFEP